MNEKDKALSDWMDDIKRQLLDLAGDVENFQKAVERVPENYDGEITTWEQCDRCTQPAPVIAGVVCCAFCQRELERGAALADGLLNERLERADR